MYVKILFLTNKIILQINELKKNETFLENIKICNLKFEEFKTNVSEAYENCIREKEFYLNFYYTHYDSENCTQTCKDNGYPCKEVSSLK